MLWDRYLWIEGPLNPDIGDRQVRWLRDAFHGAALKAGKPAWAALFRRDPRRIPAAPLPSFDEFAERHGGDGFLSERELQDLWKSEFGNTPAGRQQARRSRLVARLLEAIHGLEPLAASVPSPSDSVHAWLREEVARRLEGAGIATLGALMGLVRDRGYHWYRKVPRLGVHGAERLVRWLRESEESLGTLPVTALAPRRQLMPAVLGALAPRQVVDVAPIERFQVPAELSGADGTYRTQERSLITARNDLEAVGAWLDARATNANTRRSYRKEAERLVLWAVLERGKPLSGLGVEDCSAYRTWLGLLGRLNEDQWALGGWRLPQSAWIGSRRTERWSEAWRPFDGPLGERSRRQALVILRGLFGFLARVHYIVANPWAEVPDALPAVNEDARAQFVERSLTRMQMQRVLDEADAVEGFQGARLRAVLWLGFGCGLRLAEMLSLTTRSLDATRAGRYRLVVTGKGAKTRFVPLPSPVLDALQALYTQAALAFVVDPGGADVPLLAKTSGIQDRDRVALSRSGLARALDAHLERCARKLAEEGDHLGAARLRRASVHWLRHTCGVTAATEGVPLNLVQQLLGHADVRTTSAYTVAGDDAVADAMERLMGAGLIQIGAPAKQP